MFAKLSSDNSSPFSPGSHPSLSQIKAAYKKEAWEFHPDPFPDHQKSSAESKFKLVSEAYDLLQLQSGRRGEGSGSYYHVVKTGVPRMGGGTRSYGLVKVPFLLIIFGTVSLGVLNASRAYKKQKEITPSHNPFLP